MNQLFNYLTMVRVGFLLGLVGSLRFAVCVFYILHQL